MQIQISGRSMFIIHAVRSGPPHSTARSPATLSRSYQAYVERVCSLKTSPASGPCSHLLNEGWIEGLNGSRWIHPSTPAWALKPPRHPIGFRPSTFSREFR